MVKETNKELRAEEDKYLAPGLQQFAIASGIVVDHAQGSEVWDVEGKRYIDIIGGIGVNGLGHSHPQFVKAIQEQVAQVSVGSFTSKARIEFLKKVSKYFPIPEAYCVQLYSSGAEAVESALRLAKSYTKKSEFVSFYGGFHGKTMGTLSLMGSTFKQGFGPMLPGHHVVPYASCYRCPLGKEYPSCEIACLKAADLQLEMNSTGNIAAFIIEPFQGTNGNQTPPLHYLREVWALAKKWDALLIADEMITGFGRTGKFWGFDHADIKPDIITMGKQFGGGFPMSAVMAKKEIANSKPWANPSGSSSSYGGNPLASAAALAALTIIEEEDLVTRSKEMGAYFLERLQHFEKFPFVGQVRGVGLFLGIELVKDKQTKQPLSRHICQQLFHSMLEKGLLTMAYAPSFRIQPSMTISREIIDESVEIMESVFDLLEKDGHWREEAPSQSK